MMMKLLIIKLGGAAITDKKSLKTAKTDIIKKIAGQIKILHEQKYKIIIVHGAGSFGHILANEYGFNGDKNLNLNENMELGASKIRNSVQKLNQIILDVFDEYNIKSYSIPVSSNILKMGKLDAKLEFFNLFNLALENNLIPITYGDICLNDGIEKFKIISGDYIMEELVKKIEGKKHVIFGSNVDGYYDDNNGEKIIINKIKFSEIDKIIKNKFDEEYIDVTGGMQGKLRHISNLGKYVNQVDLINLEKDNAILDLIDENMELKTTFTK